MSVDRNRGTDRVDQWRVPGQWLRAAVPALALLALASAVLAGGTLLRSAEAGSPAAVHGGR